MRRLSSSRIVPRAPCAAPSIRICGLIANEPSPVRARPWKGCVATAVASSAETAYRSRQPVFQTVMDNSAGIGPASAGVRVAGVVETTAPPAKVHDPGNPLADADGFIYMSNVNPVDELVNMISASRSYQNSVEVLSTSKELLLRTLSLGQ